MEQPAPGQDQQVAPTQEAPPAAPPAPVVPAPPAPAPSGTGPWASDLEAVFTDPNVRQSVDSFLREKVQPYTTKLEQQAGSAQDALNLWDSFQNDANDTYVAITRELYGDEMANAVSQYVQGQQQPPPEQQAPAQQLDPRLASVVEWAEQEQASKLYDQGLDQIRTANPDLANEIDKGLLHVFVANANGDFNEAVTQYRNYRAQFGVPQQPAAEPATPPAPVLGSDTATQTPSSVPQQPRKETLDEAIEGFIAEQRQSRQAPPVGSI